MISLLCCFTVLGFFRLTEPFVPPCRQHTVFNTNSSHTSTTGVYLSPGATKLVAVILVAVSQLAMSVDVPLYPS